MAVGEISWPQMHVIDGVTLASAAAGVKYSDRNDVLAISICDGASVAGVFTQNAFCAAPVTIAKAHISACRDAGHSPRVLLINSGNANACTGEAGHQAAIQCCQAAADHAGLSVEQVLPFSTGVIGELLPADKIVAVLGEVIPESETESSADSWLRAEQAIMTTDSLPKGVTHELMWDGHSIKINGIVKGAGMIRPNMATMLAFVAMDASVAPDLLDIISKRAAQRSFNRITIDGDTSTNDACILIASGKSSAPRVESADDALFAALASAVAGLYEALAKLVIRDAEGATKFVEICVQGGGSEQECLDVAYAIAHSPLVKTAFFASDPNWGRIVAAIGYAGVPNLDVNPIRMWLDEVLIVENGGRALSYQEADGQAVFDKDSFSVIVDLARGDYREKLWTSDLSHDYIKINAEYRS
ncbi:MAG: bifunctional ornithine acetyltransferase/N-acetylglutamate synthase [Alteromonadaceae bacterium]|nr:MAG: bifunctional ornithine acetyltransferase/N-acetylglutamate synthase [Alteromonadaceae bacterium]